jgi:uncharacterized membrane protein (UPF0127 family)
MIESATTARALRRTAAVALLIATLAGPGLACGAQAPSGPTATVRGKQVTLEIARTRAEQSLGLGQRDSLPWGHGMLFPYERPAFLTFWMKGMRFDIDIVWIRDGRIVGISAFVPYPRENPDKPATVRAPELADMVLEVPAGFAQANGWRRGDRVELHGLDPRDANGP